MRPLHSFHGGLHLPEHKAESTQSPIVAAPLPRLRERAADVFAMQPG